MNLICIVYIRKYVHLNLIEFSGRKHISDNFPFHYIYYTIIKL